MILLILIPYLFLEIYISLAMLERIGALWSAVWTIVTIMIGSALIKNSPYTIMGNIYSLHRGKLDSRKFQDATTFYLLGALLLIVPGVFSDALGVLALLYTVYLQFVAKITPEQPNMYQKQTPKGDDDVIDVEIVDEHADRYDRLER